MAGSGYFPMFVDLSRKHAVVIGAGRVAARRAGVLAQFCGDIAVIAPDVHPDIEALEAAGAARVYRRRYRPGDLEGADIALACTDDAALNADIAAACRARGIPVNVCSDRALCDFYFPGIAVHGDLVAGVVAGGENHALARDAARRIRECLAADEPSGFTHE